MIFDSNPVLLLLGQDQVVAYLLVLLEDLGPGTDLGLAGGGFAPETFSSFLLFSRSALDV